MSEQQLAVSDDPRTTVEIIPFGTDERIKLNVGIVQKMVAVKTRSGKEPNATDCIKFMMLCKARHLNPFEGDAYLLGYDTQAGPQFSLITAHQVFLKRAEASEGFDGMESGVIVKTKIGVEEREGDLTYDDEKLLGDWAKVYRKDVSKPFYRRLKLETFSSGRSRWEKDPSGMIVKCAEADALRSAFPTHLGGLYMAEEHAPIEAQVTRIERPALPAEPVAALPAKKPRSKQPAREVPPEQTPAEELLAQVSERDFTEEQLVKVLIRTNLADTTAKTLADVPEPKLKIALSDMGTVFAELEELTAPVENAN